MALEKRKKQGKKQDRKKEIAVGHQRQNTFSGMPERPGPRHNPDAKARNVSIIRGQLTAWDYDGPAGVPRRGDFWLWLLFTLLLFLVIVFSQRQWLTRLFPFDISPQFHMSVEIMRPATKELKSDPAAEVSIDKAMLQQPEQLLRLTAKESGWEDTGRFRDVRLFFVQVADDSQLRLKSVLHKVPFDQKPLSRTLKRLLKGPSPQEINKGLHSMLPPEIQLLNIRIIGESAFMNLSGEFYQITQLPEVLLAAIKQLVFTVTEYPNIKALRILVDGQPIFAKNLPELSVKELARRGLNLDAEIRREELLQGEIGAYQP